MEEVKQFSERLILLRKQYGLTQKQLAEKLGITERTYQRLESGTSLPSYKTINSIIAFFGQGPADYLLGQSDALTRQ